MDNELKAYLDQQFQQMRQETAEQFAKVDQRLDRSNQRQDGLVRGVDVLGIEFLGQVRLVVESLANITQQLKRHDDKVSRELDEEVADPRTGQPHGADYLLDQAMPERLYSWYEDGNLNSRRRVRRGRAPRG